MFAFIAIVFLIPPVVVVYVVGLNTISRTISITAGAMQRWYVARKCRATRVDVVNDAKVEAPALPRVEVGPDPLVVISRSLGPVKEATIVLRARPADAVITVHLIIWATVVKKRPKRKTRVEDSYYDLGAIPAKRIGDVELAAAMSMVDAKLVELTRRETGVTNAVTAAVESPPIEEMQKVEKSPEVKAAAVVATGKHAEAVRLKQYPSVHRGKVVKLGMLSKQTEKDGIIEKFGVQLLTPDGNDDFVWGVDLKAAFAEANAVDGDDVEIMKVGRKFVEKGKAPMNLYRVAKLTPQANACQV